MSAPTPWSQGSGLPPPELPPRRALAELAIVVGVLYLVIYGGAALGGFEKRFENPLLSVATSAVLMLLLVMFFAGRDPKWRQSLALEGRALDALLFGVVGFFGAYGVNIVLGLGYYAVLKLFGGHPETLATSKAQWASQLSTLPIYAMIPIAALAGFWEEIVFRGFVLGRARAWLGAGLKDPFRRDAVSVLFASALFGLGHGYQGGFGLIQTGLVGVVFGTLTLWRRSVWPAVVAHLAIDSFGLIMLHVLKPMLEQLLKGVKPG